MAYIYLYLIWKPLGGFVSSSPQLFLKGEIEKEETDSLPYFERERERVSEANKRN